MKYFVKNQEKFLRSKSNAHGEMKNPLAEFDRGDFLLVPKGGFEPPRAYAHCALNAARLPVPPLRQMEFLKRGQCIKAGGESQHFCWSRKGWNRINDPCDPSKYSMCHITSGRFVNVDLFHPLKTLILLAANAMLQPFFVQCLSENVPTSAWLRFIHACRLENSQASSSGQAVAGTLTH